MLSSTSDERAHKLGTFAKKFRDLGLLFITNAVFNHIPVFHLRRYAEIAMTSLSYCVENQWFELYVYALMPNHIHLILKTNENHPIGPILRDFKKFTSQQVLLTMRDADPYMLPKFQVDTNKQKYKLWVRDLDIKNIVTPGFLIQKAEYIHQNPVRAEWADSLGIYSPEDYEYSSARFYLGGVMDKYVKLSDFRKLL
jgi:REP element-mobilizing transposase RayT